MGLRKNPAERAGMEDDKRTVHLRIASDYRNRILSGDIEAGQTLPWGLRSVKPVASLRS